MGYMTEAALLRVVEQTVANSFFLRTLSIDGTYTFFSKKITTQTL